MLDEALPDDRALSDEHVDDAVGIPASRQSSPSRIAESGVSSAGFRTTVLPHASAGPSFQLAMFAGKFHGTMRPTTPSGSRKVAATPPARGIVSPPCLSTAPA